MDPVYNVLASTPTDLQELCFNTASSSSEGSGNSRNILPYIIVPIVCGILVTVGAVIHYQFRCVLFFVFYILYNFSLFLLVCNKV